MSSDGITGEGRLLLTPRGARWRELIRRLVGTPEEAFMSAVRGPFLVEVPQGVELGPFSPQAVDGRLMSLLRAIDDGDAVVHDLAPRHGDDPVVIGRSEQSADVVLDSQVVSKRHAEVSIGKSGWRVSDLESANGTYCEDRRLPSGIPSPVESGEQLRFTQWRGVLLSPAHLFTLLELATKQTTVAGGGLTRSALRDTLRRARVEGGGAPLRLTRAPSPAPRPAGPRPGAVPNSGRVPASGTMWEDALLRFRELRASDLPEGPYLVELPEGVLEDTREADPVARISELKRADLSAGRVFSLEPPEAGAPTLIGRTACDVELGNSEASRRHAKFTSGSRWQLLDLESANGTSLAGCKLPPGVATALESTQVVAFSSLRFVVLSREHYHLLVHNQRVTQDLRSEQRMRQLLATPADGLPLRELVEIVGGFKEGEFLRGCRARFLLQVPVVLPDAPATAEEEEEAIYGGTQDLSHTRILALQRSKQISHARVHTLHAPEEGGLVAGRDPGCDLVIDERSVSKRHAQFRHTRRGWCLLDLDSHNGTFVEGEQVPANVLVPLGEGTSLSLASYCALWLSPPMVHKLLSFVAKERGKS